MAQRYSLPFFLSNKHHQPRKRRKKSTQSVTKSSQKPPQTKECYHCHQFKPLSLFDKNRRKRGGYSHICKQCAKKQRIRFQKLWAKERARRKPTITEKRCIHCHQIRPISEFSVTMDHKYGRENVCCSCHKKDVQKLHKKWTVERLESGTPAKKRCVVCHKKKPASSFYDTVYVKDGLYNICRDCFLAQKRDLQQRWKEERTKQPMPAQKTCHRCHRTLAVTAFYPSDHAKDGVENICIDCDTQRHRDLVSRWSEDRKTHPVQIEEKTCPRCQQRLAVSFFYPNEAQKDGYSEYCKTCSQELSHGYRDKWETDRRRRPSREKTAQCEMCKSILPLTKFHRNRSYKSGYSPVCIPCTNEQVEHYIQKWQAERKALPSEKQCRQCHRILPINNFRKNRKRKEGFDHLCNACYKKNMSAYITRWDKERKQKESGISLFESFEKTCTSCKRTLPLSMFYTKKCSKGGYTSACKDCIKKKSNQYLERVKSQPKIIPKEKVCNSCKQLLPAAAFSRSLHSPDGLFLYCKKCSNKKHREYYYRPAVHERLLKRSREYQKQQYHARKQQEEIHVA